MRHYALVRLGLPVFALGLLFLSLNTTSSRAAGPWYVTSGGSDATDCLSPATACASIDGAIGKASDGDTIYVAAGTYTNATDSQVVLLSKSLTISGGWDDGFSVQTGMSMIDGQQTRSGIAVNSGVTVTAEYLVVQNCRAGSTAGIANWGTLTLTHCVIRNNVGATAGGGIVNRHSLTINDSTISGNRSLILIDHLFQRG